MLLYHYTTVAGLIGILTHRKIWASDCQYLNDGTELAFARDIFFAQVEAMALDPASEGAGYCRPHQDSQYSRVFVTCFCEQGDLLSQWRGYTSDHGYAIAFESDKLEQIAHGTLEQVIYGVFDPPSYFAQELQLAQSVSAHPGVAEWHAAERLVPKLAKVKHPGFSEEREWRPMTQVPHHATDEEYPRIHFRPSPMGPLAHIIHSFTADCVTEIVVGPGAHSVTRRAAVAGMLRHLNMHHVEIRASQVPLRT